MASTLTEYQPTESCTVRVVQGDLTGEQVDAIVNAANEELAHGGGVAGAIVQAGGQSIQDESDAIVLKQGPLRTGSATITGAGSLTCKYVIHAVGPVWGSGNEPAKLTSAVRSALLLADKHDLRSVSLPAISSGIFGFPKDQCAEVMLNAIEAHLAEHSGTTTLREIRLCNIDNETTRIFRDEVDRRRAERAES